MTKEKLGNICKLHSGGTPSTKNSQYWNGNLKWLSSSESGKDFIYDSNVLITEKGVKESSTKLASKKSVIIATAGEGKTRGQVSFLETDAYINQSLIAIKSASIEISNLYIYYYLKNNYKRLRNLSDATGIRGSLSGELLKSFEIQFPHLNIQNKITNFLRLIDLKIEINNKINAELESMAKTLYDYWFLQFEFPNEEGKPFKSSGGKMVWNEELKREIPEGWLVKSIIEIADLYQPKTISGNTITEFGKYFVYGANGIIGKYSEFNHSENEIAICCRGASCGEYLMTLPKSWITGNSMVINAKNEILKEYLYYGLSRQGLKRFVSGSAQPQITRNNLENMKVLLPIKKIINDFNKISLNFRKEVQNLMYQNQELTSLRDFLLPLLMNGQVTFKE